MVQLSAATLPGNRYGTLNQDFVLVDVLHQPKLLKARGWPQAYVAAVLDGHGMLGEEAAQQAGRAILERIHTDRDIATRTLAEVPISTLNTIMREAFQAGHVAALGVAEKAPQTYVYPRGSRTQRTYQLRSIGDGDKVYVDATGACRFLEYGTTATVAIVQGSTYVVASVGDSLAIIGHELAPGTADVAETPDGTEASATAADRGTAAGSSPPPSSHKVVPPPPSAVALENPPVDQGDAVGTSAGEATAKASPGPDQALAPSLPPGDAAVLAISSPPSPTSAPSSGRITAERALSPSGDAQRVTPLATERPGAPSVAATYWGEFITPRHNLEESSERARIAAHPGAAAVLEEGPDGYVTVVSGKLAGFQLAMSRALGHRVLSRLGVIPVPDVRKGTLPSDALAIIVASDGVWEALTPAEAIREVCDVLADARPLDEAVVALARAAVERATAVAGPIGADNTTAAVFLLDDPPETA